MLVKRYRITALDPALLQALRASGRETTWTIVANSLPSAWRKFVTQRFGALAPNPADYDIALERS